MLFSALVILAAILGTGPGVVDPTWYAPDTIQSAGDGSFYGEAVFVAGTGGAAHDYSSAMPLSNTDCCGWIADGFCMIQIAEGDSITVSFQGMIANLYSEASVQVELGVCNGGGGFTDKYTAVVRILAPDVPIEKSSFGTVKSKFRD